MSWLGLSTESTLFSITLMACWLAASCVVQAQDDPPKFRNDWPLERQQMSLLGEEPATNPTGEVGPRVSTKAGIRTANLVDRGRNVKIVEDPQRGILMEIQQDYDSRQLQQLKGKYPELRDYIDLFPTSIDGQEIELKLSLKKKYQARDASHLKQQNLEAYQIYTRHLRAHGRHLKTKRP